MRSLEDQQDVPVVLAFVTKLTEIEQLAPLIGVKAVGDALVWLRIQRLPRRIIPANSTGIPDGRRSARRALRGYGRSPSTKTGRRCASVESNSSKR
jgi:hypothetical protein